VLALAGGDALEKCLNALRPGGRMAHPNGVEPAPKKRRGMRLIRYDGISGVREFERLNVAVQAARLKVPIAECYPLPRASKAHERLAEGHVVGKIILAVQFARLRGARVFATASGKEGVELVREMGAQTVVDGKRVDVDDQARRFAPDGVDAVLALAGGDALEKCLNALRPGGRVAHPNGVEPAPKKRRGMKLIRYDGISGVREFERLNAAVQAAKLKVPIAECYPLARAHKAHERLAEGHVVGKIILAVHDGSI
jgi:NADPH:quinone reductase-like Zn-dependent oxidoreductase